MSWIPSGCNSESTTPVAPRSSLQLKDERPSAALFQNSVTTLNDLHVYADIEKYRNERVQAALEQRFREWISTGEPSVFWEPTPEEDGLRFLSDTLSQWIALEDAPPKWKPDPMVEQLAKEFAELRSLRSLNRLAFTDYDSRVFQESRWLHRTASYLKAQLPESQRGDPRAVADRLFAWVIENVQLDAASNPPLPRHFPWQSLLFGHGTQEQRAWIFARLARQVELDVVMVTLPEPAAPERRRLWCAGLVNDGEVYLYEPTLGLAIPSPPPAAPAAETGAQAAIAASPLDRPAATLKQVLADPSILKQLEVDTSHPYPVGADSLSNVHLAIESVPSDLSLRMQMFQNKLVGNDRFVLTCSPTKIADKLKAVGVTQPIELWAWPYETLLWQSSLHLPSPENQAKRIDEVNEVLKMLTMTPLYKAKILHLGGDFDGIDGANRHYLMCRIPDQQIGQLDDGPLAPEMRKIVEEQQKKSREAKQTASYWLGLAAKQRGELDVAIDYLARRTLEQWPDTFWTSGARYNLGRCYELQARQVIQSSEEAQSQAAGLLAAADNLFQQAAALEAEGQTSRARQKQREAERQKTAGEEAQVKADTLRQQALEHIASATLWFRADDSSPQATGNLLRADWLTKIMPGTSAPADAPAQENGQ